MLKNVKKLSLKIGVDFEKLLKDLNCTHNTYEGEFILMKEYVTSGGTWGNRKNQHEEITFRFSQYDLETEGEWDVYCHTSDGDSDTLYGLPVPVKAEELAQAITIAMDV